MYAKRNTKVYTATHTHMCMQRRNHTPMLQGAHAQKLTTCLESSQTHRYTRTHWMERAMLTHTHTDIHKATLENTRMHVCISA